MPKNPKLNVARYKVDGGELNEYEFQQNQEIIAQQREFDDDAMMPGTAPEAKAPAPPAQPASSEMVEELVSGIEIKAPATTTKKAAARKSTKKAGKKATKKAGKKATKKAATKATKKAGKKSTKKAAKRASASKGRASKKGKKGTKKRGTKKAGKKGTTKRSRKR